MNINKMSTLTPELAKYKYLDNLLDEVLTSSRKSNHVDIQALVDKIISDEEFASSLKQFNLMEDNSNGSEYI